MDDMNVLRDYEKRRQRMLKAYRANPPSTDEAIHLLRVYRERIEAMPVAPERAEADVNVFSSERQKRGQLNYISRLIVHLECGEITVTSDDCVRFVSFLRA